MDHVSAIKNVEFVSGIGWFLIFSKYSASFENGYYFRNDIICNQLKLAASGSGTKGYVPIQTDT